MNPTEPAVLIVDDELLTRKALLRNLEPLGAPLAACADGAQALAWLQHHRAAVIIADYSLPGMNGLEFLRQACRLQPDSARLMLTGTADLDVAWRAIEENLIERYISKPWDPDKLRKIVDALWRDPEPEGRTADRPQ